MDVELLKFLANYGSLGIFAFIFFRYIDRTVKKQDQMTQRLFDKQDETTNNLVELMTLLKDNIINSKFSNKQLHQVLQYKYTAVAFELQNKMANYIYKNNIIKNYGIIKKETFTTIEHILRNYRNELEPLVEETKFDILINDLNAELKEMVAKSMEIFDTLKQNETHSKEELDTANREIKSLCDNLKNNLLFALKKVC